MEWRQYCNVSASEWSKLCLLGMLAIGLIASRSPVILLARTYYVTLIEGAQAQEQTSQRYTYFIKITEPVVAVYTSPSFGSRIMFKGKQDQELEIAEKKTDWLRVKVPIPEGGYVYGWVEVSKTKYKVLRKTLLTHLADQDKGALQRGASVSLNTASDPQKPEKVQKEKKTSSADNPFRQGATFAYRVFAGPVYSIKNYFSNSGLSSFQYRVGLGVDRVINDKLWLSVPVMYAQGQGFKTISGGLNAYLAPVDLDQWMPYAKLGATFEHLFSGGNSFQGVNVVTGIGVDYVLSDSIAIGIEPISLQTMVYRSAPTIPINVRGQLLLSVRGTW